MAGNLPTPHDTLFPGGGEMGARLRAHDWAATALGPVAGWPQSLTTAVRIMLGSRFAMWMAWGPDLTFFCNDAYKPTLGVKEAWALGSRSDVVWAEIWPDIGPRIAQVLRTGQATWDEALLLFLERRGFSEESYHTFSYSPLADESGIVTGMLCVVSEETERVIGERRLRCLRDLGAGMAAARTVAEVGAVVAACLGEGTPDLPVALAYLVGDEPALLARAGLGPDHPAAGRAAEAAAAALAHRDPAGPAAVAADALGPLFADLPSGPWDRPPVHARVVPIAQQGQDRPAGVFVAGLNPYRPLDEAYRGFVDLFVGQIATGLANANAYEAERRRAEAFAELDRQKTVFFSNVSHEFRTPLTLMLGPLTEVLESSAVDPDTSRLVELAHRNGLRLLKLVNALLDFSRIEAGRAQAAYEPLDLARFTAELASSFRSATDKAGLVLDVDCTPLPEPAFVDPEMWEKIVLNLVSNAFKFTLDGEIAVRLRAQGDHAVLTVSDTGLGIPEAELPRLFERFQRVEGAQGRSFEGSGIGLALVQELVRLHGGTVGVESAPGRGSTFTVSLPLGRAHLPPERIRAARAGISTATRSHVFVEEATRWLDDEAAPASDLVEAPGPAGLTGRVLLADDNSDMRAYVRRLLGDAGHGVEAVGDGQAALAAARRRAPDLVLSDVMMPGLDGFGLLAALRADPALRGIPVILLSARAGEEARIEGLAAGADDYLIKPFSARELLARVETNLRLARVRHEAADALRQVNETLEAQVAARTRERDRMWRLSRDVMLVARFDGTITALNPAWRAVLGWEAQDLIGLPFLDLVHPDDRARTRAETQRLADGHATLLFENRYRHADGSYRTLSWTAVPGEEHLHAVGRDVTEQRELEEAFRQSQKMEAVGQLTGGIAHDFNNLLTGIVGSLDLLSTRLSQGRLDVAPRYIEAALTSAHRAAALTHRLLAFARRQPLDPRPVDANALVVSLEDLVRRTLGETVALETRLAEGLWPTLCDANQLESAILNLAINARDAMPEGGRLVVETRNVELDAVFAAAHGDVAPGAYLRLAVTDTGTGMPPEVVRRAFDPFFTTKPLGQGTGLGLSMIYGFARQSDGHAVITSEVGRGTTVALYLPRHAGPPAAEVPAPAPAATPPAGSGETVLVVEDEPAVRSLIVDVLRDLGYRALEAKDGPAGLAALRGSARIDLLVTDVGLPGLNGRQLADAAREHRPDLKVLFITGYAENAAMAGFLAPGMQMITKPFPLELLARRIRAMIEG
ncbi:ATP-binding protein [Methylobacterium sp. 17Sr1-1]|uniref:ATP-binding response regulator n=1 Tax=Methylobacterium sp. 17Sr1-1 TaxID=2202826 RepID=UPI000D6EDA1B|nr:ATP-binding protein [Methylobacterium sp. 17Sr1-1]AWN53756.1 two-component system sensor histidine kinase/response regulator [Methylobacterium sp. 17Sr1-1]